MTAKKLTKWLALYLPYILLGLVATNFGEAWRLAEGKELSNKIMAMMGKSKEEYGAFLCRRNKTEGANRS